LDWQPSPPGIPHLHTNIGAAGAGILVDPGNARPPLRATGRNPHDHGISVLVGELAKLSEDFRTRWAAHNVRFYRTGAKDIHHPVVGDLHLMFEAMDLTADPGLSIVAYTAEPNSASQDGLDLLASWTMTADQLSVPAQHIEGTDPKYVDRSADQYAGR